MKNKKETTLPSKEICIEYHVYCPKCSFDTLVDENKARIIVCYDCKTTFMAMPIKH